MSNTHQAILSIIFFFLKNVVTQIVKLSEMYQVLSLFKGMENENTDLTLQIRERVKRLSRYILTAGARRGED